LTAFLSSSVLILAGLAAGVAGGLFGIGGGTLMMPALIGVYGARGMPADTAGLVAVATSLLAILLMSARAFVSHRRRGAGSWRAVLLMAPAGAVGALLGAEAALGLGGVAVVRAFAALQIIIGVSLVVPRSRPPLPPRTVSPHIASWLTIGFVAGLASALLGIGGGIIAVPLQMMLLAVPIHQATANSSGLITLNALAGLARYSLAERAPVAWALGSIDLGAGLLLTIAAVLAAPLGVRWAHALPAAKLRRVYGLFLVAVGVILALQAA
jgi:uncharacterized membrane protein YfcA